jgi:hypothetical protein
MLKRRRIHKLADDLAESINLFRRGEITPGNVWGLADFQREVEEFLTLLSKEVERENKAQAKRPKEKKRSTPRR